MIKYILIALISYILGVVTLIIYSMLKVSSECSRRAEKRKKFGTLCENPL